MRICFADNAYACDPRIAQFKFEEKERKQAGKRAKQELIKQKAEEEERVGQNVFAYCLCFR